MREEMEHNQEFLNDIESLRPLYRAEVIEMVEANIDLLLPTYDEWRNALKSVGDELGVDTQSANEIPYGLEKVTYSSVQSGFSEEDSANPMIIGLAGPGAAGKGAFSDQLGFPKVINTTTRPKRSYETDGVQYHFVSDEKYHALSGNGSFLVASEKPGRGLYGIQKGDLQDALEAGKAIVEESPLALAKLSKAAQEIDPRYRFTLTYVLPPSPVLPHLAARLANRCLDAKEDFHSQITSTTDKRQTDEFRTLVQVVRSGVSVLILVNDKVERIAGLPIWSK
ncbi:MAG: hypothetical protein Q7S37_02030 [bacterium]|nr:hypothetical protein [bacterium]